MRNEADEQTQTISKDGTGDKVSEISENVDDGKADHLENKRPCYGCKYRVGN